MINKLRTTSTELSQSRNSSQRYEMIMTKGPNVEVKGDVLNKLLESPAQLFQIERGNGTFDIINKAHIVQTVFIGEVKKPEDNPDNYEFVDGVYKLKKDYVQ